MSALCLLYVCELMVGTPRASSHPLQPVQKNARGVPKSFGSLRSLVRTPLSKSLKSPLTGSLDTIIYYKLNRAR